MTDRQITIIDDERFDEHHERGGTHPERPERLTAAREGLYAAVPESSRLAFAAREATAEGYVEMKGATLRAIVEGAVPKGEVLATARLAGIMAAKKCGELIPLCHPLPIESVTVDFDVPELEPDSIESVQLRIRSTARARVPSTGSAPSTNPCMRTRSWSGSAMSRVYASPIAALASGPGGTASNRATISLATRSNTSRNSSSLVPKSRTT